ncbi:peptidylprolyl isomerase [Mycobacterium sp. MS1601]|uniref:peptidylprolyl isomerase n=1 Tax=Mycobacterium sp. MS1601 TaxID=1936029 RepID=UPI0012FC281B|nr:peptidylprolyl isomerase [Mycobacterium sp. MS1601]
MTVPPPYGPPTPQWPQQPWPPHPYPWPPQPRNPTNGLAVASIISAVLLPPLGALLGHLSLWQIKKADDAAPQEGRNLAIAGLIIGYSLTLVTVLAVVAVSSLSSWVNSELDRYDPISVPAPLTPRPEPAGLPRFDPPADLGSACAYPATASPASKPVKSPRSGAVPTSPAVVAATMTTSDGAIGLELDNGKSPCTVNSFVSLAQQGFFDNTPCHRLTSNNSLSVLQCGDPTGTGTGGPGYEFANEYPSNQFAPDDPDLAKAVLYPRGTLAMANAGPDTNGSQFFIVYADSRLPPTYTVFGSVDETGLATVDDIAARGVVGGNLDGRPARPVTVESIRLD